MQTVAFVARARRALMLGLGLTLCGLPAAAQEREAPSAESLAEMQEWLANRYPPGALVTVVTSSLGNVFDCVSRAHQPALQRPDGTFRPIATPPAAPGNATQPKLSAGEAVATPETIVCPQGSVPMFHVELETLMRFGSLAAFFAKHPGDRPSQLTRAAGSTALHQYAKVTQTVANWGGDAVFNLWNPFVARSNEFSLSQIGAARGSGSDFQTLESGWQDFEDLYNSNLPKLFVYSTQDGYINTGCYNGTCGDFVQVSATITPGIGWTVHSSVGGTQYIIQLRWQRDDTNDNWWLMYGTTWVGYYPGSLYDAAGVRNEASFVVYQGEIINDAPAGHTNTDMGSGGFPAGGWQQTAYTRTLRTISTSNTWQAAGTGVEFRTDADCYDVDLAFSAGTWANYFYFGGEGLGPNCQ